MLKKEDNKFLKDLKAELEDTHNKAQVYRTETEMRYSVLNDGRFPTKASKYWQAVREQNVFYTNLRMEAYEYRKLLVEIKKLESKGKLSIKTPCQLESIEGDKNIISLQVKFEDGKIEKIKTHMKNLFTKI